MLLVLIMVVIMLLLMMMLFLLMVTLYWLTMHLSNETTLSMDMVRHGSFVAIGIDQVIFAFSFVSFTRFLLTVNISGVVIMDTIMILVMSWRVMFFLVLVVVAMLRLVMHFWLMVHLNLRLMMTDLVMLFFYMMRFWLVVLYHCMMLLLKMVSIVPDSTLSTYNRGQCQNSYDLQ